MKIVVIGGSGLIGSKVVNGLGMMGHEVVAASPQMGVNTITGEGLEEAIENAQVVIDLANSPSFEDKAVMEFFETSGKNLLPVEVSKGVKHHIALSIVGTDRPSDIVYFKAKQVQERLIRESGIPYSIIHSTQFFEFLGSIANGATSGGAVYMSPALFQPIAANDVAAAVVRVATGEPLNGMVEIAGPEQMGFDEFIKRYLDKMQDPRRVITDVHAKYFGAELDYETLVPHENPFIGAINFDTWFKSQLKAV